MSARHSVIGVEVGSALHIQTEFEVDASSRDEEGPGRMPQTPEVDDGVAAVVEPMAPDVGSLSYHDSGQAPLLPPFVLTVSTTFVTSASFPQASAASTSYGNPSIVFHTTDTPLPSDVNLVGTTPSSTDLIAPSNISDPLDSLMQRRGRKCFTGFIATALSYVILSGVGLRIVGGSNAAEAWENSEWVAGGKFWLDRQLCRWFGACGTWHMINKSAWTSQRIADGVPSPMENVTDFWTSGEEDPNSWTDEEIRRREIPQYVFDHAPYVHLFSGEQFWPCDLGEHLLHTTPRLNYTTVIGMEQDRNLSNLHELNDLEAGGHGRFVYLQSDDNVEDRPNWLGGGKNIPTPPKRLEELDVTWPDENILDNLDLLSTEQNAMREHERSTQTDHKHSTLLMDRTPSENGRCGGISGYTCKGSHFGQCCSIHGWCGGSEDHCENFCDPMAGDCIDPLDPPPGPKLDLRRSKRHFRSTKNRPDQIGRSSAPAILVTVDKGDGILDAFWFFFYSYNLGQKVLNVRFGNHVGDWEHTMIRFKDGQPDSIFFSEHNFGDAYTWQAVEKYLPDPDGSGAMLGTWSNRTIDKVAKRPVVYSATGSHAMYATPGLHPYVLPWGLLHDQTDRGPLWDPALNVKSFTYDHHTKIVRASNLNPLSPAGWFDYAGHWGDKYYPLSDPRQYRFAGQYHYVNGPTGPKFKNLGRKNICQGRGECHVRNWLGGPRPRRLPIEEDVEEGGLPGGNYTDDVL